MNEVEKRQDQADDLRTRMIDEYRQENGKYPPRSEIHKGKDKKTKRKMKYPIISILALFFILLPVLFLSMNLYYGSREDQSSTEELDIGENRVYISSNQESDNQSTEMDESPNTGEDIESESEGNSNEDNGGKVIEDPTPDTNEKQTESEEVVNPPSTTTTEVLQSESTEDKSQDQYREIKTHKVATGETLFSIAIKYYNNRSGEEIIRQYNNLAGNEIYVGQTLKIPIK
ncbi:LysM peptidoglycan-binding domain-containing protein [Metabacillus schmidteae]|uniref:LysM peptidoglycan-binding domain-containing protein n=1 Tax=Metabacillus schmidteae TaxID=2730405 RepID=UPI00158959F2|nr:LysM peptidoglycan-binding domain-containing protein [Metabacillus schmidteae]